MYTSSNEEKEKDEEITPDSKPSTPDPLKTSLVINSNDTIDTTEKLPEYYYDANIDHYHPNFHMIQKTVKEERIYLRASIYLFNKSDINYSSANYLSTKNVAGP